MDLALIPFLILCLIPPAIILIQYLHFLFLEKLIMASKAEALAAIEALNAKTAVEHEQVLAAIAGLKAVIADRPEVPDDVVAAINTAAANIEGIFTPEGEPIPGPEPV